MNLQQPFAHHSVASFIMALFRRSTQRLNNKNDRRFFQRFRAIYRRKVSKTRSHATTNDIADRTTAVPNDSAAPWIVVCGSNLPFNYLIRNGCCPRYQKEQNRVPLGKRRSLKTKRFRRFSFGCWRCTNALSGPFLELGESNQN